MWNLTLRRRIFALLLLSVLYGICLILLQNLAPDLVPTLFWASLVAASAIFLWKLWTIRKTVWRLCLFPIRFYTAGSVPIPASEASAISVIVSAAFCVGLFVVLLLTLIPVFAVLLAVPLAVMAFFAWKAGLDILILPRRFLVHLRNAPPLITAILPRMRRSVFALEMGIIIATTVLTTRPFYESPANWQLSGNESEWLTSTIAAAHTGLQQTGRIPRWQPYLEQGEPITENPFNFIFNPFASVPSLLLGPVMGLRISVIMGYFLAGIGGWFLGRVLGFDWLGRVFLGMLMIGKGNLHAAMNSGYYQLALSQIYMPYVIGGVVAVFRWPKQRWPVVLTGLSLALQFLSGNIWYVLPTTVGAICAAGALLIGTGKRWVDFTALKRLMLAAVFAVGLSAVVALPVVLQFKQLGRHPDEIDGGWFVPLPQILQLYVDPNPDQVLSITAAVLGGTETYRLVRELDEFYYSFVTPAWFLLLILVALPLYRPIRGREWRIGLVALLLFGLASLWGAGGKQPILWLYQNITFLAQWRYIGRALAVGSFWLAVLVAMRVDNLWRYIVTTDWAELLELNFRWIRFVPLVLAAGLVVASLLAGAQVNDQWYRMDHIVNEIDPTADRCVTWLRSQHPNDQLALWQQNYIDITTLLNNRVRSWFIGADFEMLPQPNTLGSPSLNLNKVPPQFIRLNYVAEVPWPYADGYHILLESPRGYQVNHCLFERSDVLPYAYTVTRAAIESMTKPAEAPKVDLKAFSVVNLFERRGDQVALIVTDKRTQPTIVGVQERAYPGWRVEVDGQPAQLESVGGQIGVILPAGDQPVQVYFVYDPKQPVIGGIITLLTALACTVFLLSQRRQKIDD